LLIFLLFIVFFIVFLLLFSIVFVFYNVKGLIFVCVLLFFVFYISNRT